MDSDLGHRPPNVDPTMTSSFYTKSQEETDIALIYEKVSSPQYLQKVEEHKKSITN
jgi:hypothetical protein